MKNIKITHISDSMGCETCGSSYASGYRIEIDGELVVDKTPSAHCYDGVDYSEPHSAFEDLSNVLAERLMSTYPENIVYTTFMGGLDYYESEWEKFHQRQEEFQVEFLKYLSSEGYEVEQEDEDIGCDFDYNDYGDDDYDD